MTILNLNTVYCAVTLLFLFGCGGDDGNSSDKATSGLSGTVWKLKTIQLNSTEVAYGGTYYIEFKEDNTFVHHEAYFSSPGLNYGPCWYLSKGTSTLMDKELTTTITEQKGRSFCLTEENEGTTVWNYVLENDRLTLTDISAENVPLVMVFDKDTEMFVLDYDNLATVVAKKTPIVVRTDADSYIEDKNENDNLMLVETTCDLNYNGYPKISQYFTSELWGNGRTIGMDYSGPRLSDWTDNTHVEVDQSSSCGSPGYRDYLTSDVAVAKAGTTSGDILYACGGTCTYTLVSETHDTENNYTSLSMTWVCENVALNPLSSPSLFGLTIDKHVGKVTCP